MKSALLLLAERVRQQIDMSRAFFFLFNALGAVEAPLTGGEMKRTGRSSFFSFLNLTFLLHAMGQAGFLSFLPLQSKYASDFSPFSPPLKEAPSPFPELVRKRGLPLPLNPILPSFLDLRERIMRSRSLPSPLFLLSDRETVVEVERFFPPPFLFLTVSPSVAWPRFLSLSEI